MARLALSNAVNGVTLSEHARRLNSRCARTILTTTQTRLPPLFLMTDAERLPDPLAAARALPRGSGVILRHYGAPERERLARALARIARLHGLVLLIGADAGLALRVGAAGVHLPEAALRKAKRRRKNWLVTAAAHDGAALWRAARAGVDAAFLSPVFSTASHPGARSLGVGRFGALTRRSPIPVYALGGITPQNAGHLAATNAAGIAAIGAFAP